ncbi:hypothetical protein A200_05202 [Parascardovia denticolens IPLA 20019]|uniref:ABC transporter permease n=1 Tax=Parascardovia denticolens TaxID=78258 RepID=UPI0002669E1B|nr:ABC transporter permease [Parascardovia denticolens]EIT87949.1 hypothetical protein A200_05202 [Parascardovia denticolens IPLA 20019]
MKKIRTLLAFECRRMLTSTSTLIYAIIYFISYIISAIFFKLYGSDGSVLTVASAQSFPIQHLQAGILFTGTFVAIYVAQITRQERTQGTIKLILLRPVSRSQYYISRILSIASFSMLLTLIQITVGYLVGMLFFGWHGSLVFGGMTSSGLTGIGLTFLSGAAFSFAYFAFGLLMLLLSEFLPRLIDCAVTGMIILLVGQYAEVVPCLRQYVLVHQMLFFHQDIFGMNAVYNLRSAAVILAYSLICGFIGYHVFRNEDLSV